MSRIDLLAESAGYVDGANLFQYVNSSPLDHLDPTGLVADSVTVSATKLTLALLGALTLLSAAEQARNPAAMLAAARKVEDARRAFRDFLAATACQLNTEELRNANLLVGSSEVLVARAAVVASTIRATITGSVPAIAAALGETEERIRRAIHAAKRRFKMPGNPDVTVDTETGDIYPVVPETGERGEDPQGNIFDELEDLK